MNLTKDYRIAASVALALSWIVNCPVYAGPGDLDPTFGVAGEVEVVVAGVRGRSMAEVAFHAQRVFPRVHRFAEVVMADLFREDFEVTFGRLIVSGPHSHNTGNGKGSECGDNGEFSVMQHLDNFGPPR